MGIADEHCHKIDEIVGAKAGAGEAHQGIGSPSGFLYE
jgi:hypothetical protein